MTKDADPGPDLRYDSVKREPTDLPPVAIRVVTTFEDRTRRIDLALGGEQSVAIEDGVATAFPTVRLWPVVRDLLPPVGHLRADPRGRPPLEPRLPGPGFVEDCRAFVALTVVTDDPADVPSVRSWLATDDELWAVTPLPDGTNHVVPAPPGALADLLVWDVTAALESLMHRTERRAS